MALVIGIIACDRGPGGRGLGRIARPARHVLGREGDLHGHRGRRPFRRCSSQRSGTETWLTWSTSAATADSLTPMRNARRHPRARPRGRLRRAADHERARPRRLSRRDPRLRRRLGHRQVGPDAHHPRAHARSGPARSRSSARTSTGCARRSAQAVERRWGVLFQQGALFSVADRASRTSRCRCANISTSPRG